MQPNCIQHISRPPLEQRYIDETIASIRLRTRYNDPYEEWEKQTRKDALVSLRTPCLILSILFIYTPISICLQKTARKELADNQAHLLELQDRKHVAEQKRLELVHTNQLAEIQSFLDLVKEEQQKEETKLKQTWKLRDQLLWERIEAGIKVEVERVEEEKRKLEEERQRKEKEAGEKKRAEEEKRRLEEETQQKEKDAKEKKERAEKEKRRLEDETQRKEKEAKERMNPANDDWRVARQNLLASVKFLTFVISSLPDIYRV
jgi:nucleoporin GLE1